MKRRLFTLALVLCMMLVTSCGGDTSGESAVNTDTADTAADTGATADDELTPDIPNDLRFDGRTFHVLATPDANYGPILEDFELEKNATVLSIALYERLVDTEERFGISIDLNYGVEHEIVGMSRSSVNSGSHDYDLVADVAEWHYGAVYEGLYMPVNDLPYVDLDKPWWNKAYIESVSINPDNPYILFGPINLKGIERSVCTYFNIDLLEELTEYSEQDMYDMVLAGDWTIDKMTEIAEGVYFDDNGNTVRDEEDIYGFAHWNYWQVNFMAHSSGLKFTDRDEDGYPVLNLNNEKSIELADKLLTLFSNKEFTFNHGDNHGSVLMFGTGHSLFHVNRFFILTWEEMRQNDVNYGILPCPKYDESIDNYYGAVANNTQWQMVPITEPDPQFASAVIEYLAWYGYKEVIPAYFDISLKFKYTRGDLDGASQMLDLIVANQYTDFMGVNSLGGMESIFTTVCRNGQNTFSSTYARYESTAQMKLAEYIETLG